MSSRRKPKKGESDLNGESSNMEQYWHKIKSKRVNKPNQDDEASGEQDEPPNTDKKRTGKIDHRDKISECRKAIQKGKGKELSLVDWEIYRPSEKEFRPRLYVGMHPDYKRETFCYFLKDDVKSIKFTLSRLGLPRSDKTFKLVDTKTTFFEKRLFASEIQSAIDKENAVLRIRTQNATDVSQILLRFYMKEKLNAEAPVWGGPQIKRDRSGSPQKPSKKLKTAPQNGQKSEKIDWSTTEIKKRVADDDIKLMVRIRIQCYRESNLKLSNADVKALNFSALLFPGVHPLDTSYGQVILLEQTKLPIKFKKPSYLKEFRLRPAKVDDSVPRPDLEVIVGSGSGAGTKANSVEIQDSEGDLKMQDGMEQHMQSNRNKPQGHARRQPVSTPPAASTNSASSMSAYGLFNNSSFTFARGNPSRVYRRDDLNPDHEMEERRRRHYVQSLEAEEAERDGLPDNNMLGPPENEHGSPTSNLQPRGPRIQFAGFLNLTRDPNDHIEKACGQIELPDIDMIEQQQIPDQPPVTGSAEQLIQTADDSEQLTRLSPKEKDTEPEIGTSSPISHLSNHSTTADWMSGPANPDFSAMWDD